MLMKTVFKVGMKVYDQVNFPGKEGVIIDTNKNNKLNLLVKFDSVNYLYTLKGIYLGCNGTPTLSTKPYKVEFQGFEQKAPVRTYEEAVEWLESTEGSDIMKDSVFLTKGNYYTNLNKCTEALKKLIILRDYYNEGWQPNYKNKETKYTIYTWSGLLTDGDTFDCNRILCFKTEEIRDKFLEEQRELLEIAKPLL